MAYRFMQDNEPAGTIIVRVVKGQQGPKAFIRNVIDPDDIAEDSIEQSEELPVPEALALARNKAANIEGGATVVIELDEGVAWNQAWGQVTSR